VEGGLPHVHDGQPLDMAGSDLRGWPAQCSRWIQRFRVSLLGLLAGVGGVQVWSS
jgi:hypothetical protein